MATEDFGRTWSDLTARQTLPGELGSELALSQPFFLDPEHGWVTANGCAIGRALLFRTASGGTRWGRTPIPPSTCNAGAGTTPSFVDARHGWLVHLEPTGESASIQRTTDGGRSWSRERDFSWIAGLRFVDAVHGWLGGANLHGGAGLFRTADGGRTWRPVSAPLPPCCRGWIPLFDAPTFFDASHGLAPVTLRKDDRSVIAFDATSDGGRTWHLAASPLRAGGGATGFPTSERISVATARDWWVLPGSRPRLRVTHDAGRTWRSIAIPQVRRVYAIEALDARHAWVRALEGHQAMLLATRDGGRTWRTLAPIAQPSPPGSRG